MQKQGLQPDHAPISWWARSSLLIQSSWRSQCWGGAQYSFPIPGFTSVLFILPGYHYRRPVPSEVRTINFPPHLSFFRPPPFFHPTHTCKKMPHTADINQYYWRKPIVKNLTAYHWIVFCSSQNTACNDSKESIGTDIGGKGKNWGSTRLTVLYIIFDLISQKSYTVIYY